MGKSSGVNARAVPEAITPAARAGVDVSPGPAGRPTRSRAYELVIDWIEQQIASGSLHVDDRVPAERDLAAMLAVSRSAVREAIRVLEAHGVVRAGVGVGPDGGTILTSMPSEALTQMLRLHIALANFPMADVIEARVMLERWSARLAAQQATDKDLAVLRGFVETMEASRLDRPAFNEADTRFHVAIAEAGRNRLVADMTTAIRDSMRTPILHAFQANTAWIELVDTLIGQHRAVYEAILARDGSGAADAVERHIRYAFAALGWGNAGQPR